MSLLDQIHQWQLDQFRALDVVAGIPFQWHWPLHHQRPRVPTGDEPGAFGTLRKHDRHTGVDLYCPEGTVVLAMAEGVVLSKMQFTGPPESPWWRETWALLVRNDHSVILYGELAESSITLKEGARVFPGDPLGAVTRVLKNDKQRPMSMLHIELYDPEAPDFAVWWNDQKPAGLWNPTEGLKRAFEEG